MAASSCGATNDSLLNEAIAFLHFRYGTLAEAENKDRWYERLGLVFDALTEVVPPLLARSETALSTDIVQLLRDIMRNAHVGEPHWSGIEQRINDAIRNAAPQAATEPYSSAITSGHPEKPAASAPVTETEERDDHNPLIDQRSGYQDKPR